MTEGHNDITPESAVLETPGITPRGRSWNLMRGLAAIAGVGILIAVSVVSLGLALLAPLGMVVARAIARRQKVPLTFFTSWLGAAFGVCGAVIVVAFVVFLQLPKETFATFGKTADSVNTARAKEPPPAWLERMVPGGASRARAQQQANPDSPMMRTFTVIATVMGVVIVYSLLAMLIGTAGWVPSLLLTYAFSGKWLLAST